MSSKSQNALTLSRFKLDANGEIDFRNIDTLPHKDDHFEATGNWGIVHLAHRNPGTTERHKQRSFVIGPPATVTSVHPRKRMCFAAASRGVRCVVVAFTRGGHW